MLNRKKYFFIKYRFELLLFLLISIFSFWLMFHTFSYQNGNILIGARLWSDFASHIPVIRSFSFGSNFPPEYALFPGEPMRFHFLFYAFVGLLEKIGFRLDYALNIPSALGFSGLLIMLYVFGKKIFNSAMVGLLSVLFFLFNGSLSFLFFFKNHPLSITTINDIVQSNTFSSFGPYDQNIVSAFWNLNIYTNQRHLGLSYGLSLLLIYIIIKPLFFVENTPVGLVKIPRKINISVKYLLKNFFLGLLLSIFFYLHLGVFTFTVVIIGIFALFFKNLRFPAIIILVVGAIFSIPQYVYQTSGGNTFSLLIKPGYLIFDNLTTITFLNYWIMNLGLPIILMIGGFIIAPVKLKKIFIAFFSLFLIGNLFQFSPEIAGNHKFFNFFMIGGVMFAAYFLVQIWRRGIIGKILAVVAIFFSIFSGIIDFFPIYNDHKISIDDYQKNPDVNWILNNTPSNSVFLNSTYLYNPASLAGRKIFMGWPYFAWSAGYNTDKRGRLRDRLLTDNDRHFFCISSKKNDLSYVILNQNNPVADLDLKVNFNFFNDNFLPLYKNTNTGTVIYSIKPSC